VKYFGATKKTAKLWGPGHRNRVNSDRNLNSEFVRDTGNGGGCEVQDAEDGSRVGGSRKFGEERISKGRRGGGELEARLLVWGEQEKL